MADVLYEGRHRAEFEVEKFSDNYNHDVVTIASGQTLEPGTVLGMSTATSKYSQTNPGSTSGIEDAVAILHGPVDASGGDKQAVVVARGPYVANGKELVWPDGITDEQTTTAIASLLAAGIRVL